MEEGTISGKVQMPEKKMLVETDQSGKGLIDQKTFKFSGTIKNGHVEIKIDFENMHSISFKCQNEAADVSQDIIIDASNLCEDEKQATFKFKFDSDT